MPSYIGSIVIMGLCYLLYCTGVTGMNQRASSVMQQVSPTQGVFWLDEGEWQLSYLSDGKLLTTSGEDYSVPNSEEINTTLLAKTILK